MRRFEGWFSAESDGPGSLAPFVQAEVAYGDRRRRFSFLIDTGSDITTLMPEDAYDLLGDSYFEIDFERAPGSTTIEGVGENGYRAIPIDTTLQLEDEADASLLLPLRIWIAEPKPDYPSLNGNWTLPSIFGRDAIRPGDFELSYIKGSAALIRSERE